MKVAFIDIRIRVQEVSDELHNVLDCIGMPEGRKRVNVAGLGFLNPELEKMGVAAALVKVENVQ